MTDSLKEKILAEMIADHNGAVERNYELAKKLFKLTPKGNVDITIPKDKLNSQQIISLYLIGKKYAKTAELCADDGAEREEIANELSMPFGTVDPKLKALVDSRNIEKKAGSSGKVIYSISNNRLETQLKEILKQVTPQ